MIRIALFAIIAAGAAAAQPYPLSYPGQSQREPDEFSLDIHAPHHATVDYYNSADRTTGSHPHELVNGDMTVGLYLTPTPGPELIQVIPPAGWIAEPASAWVDDGDSITIDLWRRGDPGM